MRLFCRMNGCLQKLSAGDMVAQDTKYHRRCLYNNEAAIQDKTQLDSMEMTSHAIALAELIMRPEWMTMWLQFSNWQV